MDSEVDEALDADEPAPSDAGSKRMP